MDLLQPFTQTPRSNSAPPVLEQELFAYPTFCCESDSPKGDFTEEFSLRRVPSDGSIVVRKVVDGCISDEEKEVYSDSELAAMAQDQGGCRILQKRLEEDPGSLQLLFSQILTMFEDLMVDPFGNYLCQKVLDLSSEDKLSQIITLIGPKLAAASLNNHGTRIVQKLIERSASGPVTNINKILNFLKRDLVSLMKDANGNHVIQKCLFSLKNMGFIYTAIRKNLVELGTSKHGCCVIQRCLDSAEDAQRMMLMDSIVDQAILLVQDAYGNYVIQYVLEFLIPEVNSRIAHMLTANIIVLSKQKFSSNVIEKCLLLSEYETQQFMVAVVNNNLGQMICDQYANYVVQRTLSVATAIQKKTMLNNIKPYVGSFKSSVIGRRIFSKLIKKYPELWSY